jgi:DNA repair exonuclease SbcCD ATPase subunit
MKKTLLCAVLATAIVLGVNGAEYRHISPVSIQLIDFNLDEMRTVAGDNLDLYLGNLASLQTDLERQKQDIADAQKNLKSEKKLYDTQVSFLKSRQAIVKNAKKFFEGEEKNYEAQIKNIKKQYDMIQKMPDVSSVAMQEQLSILRSLEQDCNDRKANASKMVKDIIEQDETSIDKANEVLSQYLIEINDKNTRLENLATQNKTALEIVKAQIKNIKDQVKAGKK